MTLGHGTTSTIRTVAFAAGAAALAVASTFGLAAPSGATGSTPAPKVIYSEGFETGTGTAALLLTGYTGAGGITYGADSAWLQHCNGVVLNSSTTTAVTAAPLNNCDTAGPADTTALDNLKLLASALGTFNGSSSPSQNQALAAYTEANPGAGKVEITNTTPITVAASGGRFYTMSVDGAAVNCSVAGAVAPAYQFELGTSGTTLPAIGAPVTGCTGQTVGSGASAIKVDTYGTSSATFFRGTQLQFALLNQQGSGGGNDAAIDDLKLYDVTPSLAKSFSDTTRPVGGTTTLTFTVTNTSDLLAKTGWSFVDKFPKGLTLAEPTVGGTCTGTSSASAGDSTFSFTDGTLPAGDATCSITLTVTSDTAGSYVNGPDNVTASGLNEPGPTTVTFVAPTVVPSNPTLPNTGAPSPASGNGAAFTVTATGLAGGGLVMVLVAARRRRRTRSAA
ncbi:MAG TPA: hypothetical protein VFE15_13615 [Marmoricola sp.]|jgi:uncharacterized repeat protein (TIGR01451 family)|nr:hypothetical protein [Marmoricola sp.]